MNWPLIISSLLAAWLGHWAWCLGRNYLAARSWGVPILVCPIDPDGIPYVILKVPMRPILKALLPERIYESFQVSIFGWEFIDKGRLHTRVGSTFAYVTPRVNELWTTDPTMSHDMLARRKNFGQLRMSIVVMGVLGPNVIASDGDDWARHRKLVAPNLNERIMKTVWDESISQSRQMASYLLSKTDGVCHETVAGLRTLAINIIGMAGYGQNRPWTSQPLDLTNKEKLTYSDSIYLVMLYLVPAALLPIWFLQLPFMPDGVRSMAKVKQAIPEDTVALLEEERRVVKSKEQQSQNFMTQLLKLSGEGNQTAGSQYLSSEEIQGNLFVFTAAGFDTTSNTMTYTIAMLVGYPQWQEWLQEELDEVMPDPAAPGDYETTYPRMLRCLAIMHETLRLFPPVNHIGKQSTIPQTLNSSLGTHHLTPTIVYINTVGLHCDKSVWGADADQFKPSRWIVEGEDGEPEFYVPPRGAFMPWSSGPRVCPGQKMSTVEFTATMGNLFRSCTVEPAPQANKSQEELRQDLLDLAQDSQPRVTLQMNRPQDMVLKWTRRV